MALSVRSAPRCTLLIVTFGVLLGSTAAAQPVREQFGELQLSVDANSWRIERPTQHVLEIVPIGPMAKIASTVVLTQAASADLGDCEVLARAQLPAPLYEEAKARTVEVGGLNAVAVHARTGCRNATPTGNAFCIPRRGIGYLLTNRIVGCRSGGANPFSRNDWFEELTRGIRFAP